MIVQIGVNNSLTYTFNASAKTLTVTGLELGNITSIKNASRGNAEMKAELTNIAVSGSVYTLTFSSVPVGSTNADDIVILFSIDGDFEDYDDTQALFNKSWSSQKIQYELDNVSGGGGGTSLTLTAPDLSQWTVTVNNSGALITTQVV